MPGLLGCPGCLGQRGPQLADLVAVIGDNSLPIDRSPVVSVDVGEAEQHVRLDVDLVHHVPGIGHEVVSYDVGFQGFVQWAAFESTVICVTTVATPTSSMIVHTVSG